MKEVKLYQEQKEKRLGDKPFQFFEPNYDEVKELYRVNDEPINIINNAENVPFIQNVAQQQLVDVSIGALDTSNFSDEQLAKSCIPRYADINEIADASRNSLNEMYNSQVNNQKSD